MPVSLAGNFCFCDHSDASFLYPGVKASLEVQVASAEMKLGGNVGDQVPGMMSAALSLEILDLVARWQ